ncbi:unnamed protein product [Fusarium graminearum]|nr:unnamed protein product [Fusarium graminearum]
MDLSINIPDRRVRWSQGYVNTGRKAIETTTEVQKPLLYTVLVIRWYTKHCLSVGMLLTWPHFHQNHPQQVANRKFNLGKLLSHGLDQEKVKGLLTLSTFSS